MWQLIAIITTGVLLRQKKRKPVDEVIKEIVKDSSGGRRFKRAAG
jgi:hypothetical protein